MTEATTFDFRTSRGLNSRVESRFSTWLDFFCRNAPDRMARVLGSRPVVAADVIDLQAFQDVISGWSDPVVGCRVGVGDQNDATMLVMPESLARILIGLMLGAPVATEEEEEAAATKPLTSVEQGLIELFVGEICTAWVEAWPETDPPLVQALSAESSPAKSRLVPMTGQLARCCFTITIDEQSAKLEWLIPVEVIGRLLGDDEQSGEASLEDRERLEAHVRSMPLEIVVRLGQADLHLRDLANLKCGDLILLDRKLGQPLEAVIDSRSRFLGWAGRVGNQQAYQIATLLGGGGDDD